MNDFTRGEFDLIYRKIIISTFSFLFHHAFEMKKRKIATYQSACTKNKNNKLLFC